MTFVEGFYSYNINLTDADRELYTSFRVKTPRHPHESLEHLFARVLAFTHCYQDDQQFTRGLFELREPTIWARDCIDDLLLWVQVGTLDKKKLKRALSETNGNTRYCIYFYSPEQRIEFCHLLRGSRSNWVKNVHFFEIDTNSIEQFADRAKSSSRWDVTIVDHDVYLDIDGEEGKATILPVDIWHCFQDSISNGNLKKIA